MTIVDRQQACWYSLYYRQRQRQPLSHAKWSSATIAASGWSFGDHVKPGEPSPDC